MTRSILTASTFVLGLGALLSPAPAAAYTCFHDPSDKSMTVNAAVESVTIGPRSGVIYVNGVACGTARTDTIDRIQIIGTQGVERVTLDLSRGTFAPGTVAEPDGLSEIEIAANLNGGADVVTVIGTSGADVFNFGSLGADLNADLDIDLTYSALATLSVYGGAGDDVIGGEGGATGAAYALPLWLLGEAGNDRLQGGSGDDRFYGGAGDDQCFGGAGNDLFLPDAGNDLHDGEAGNDQFTQDAVNDGVDLIIGGDGSDTVSYERRSVGVEISFDGLWNDGEMGVEGDNVSVDVERAAGGSGDDMILGGPGADFLVGNAGSDMISGEEGDDTILGGDGDDLIWGTMGNDTIYGQAGDDQLYGGPDNDTVSGGIGNDFVSGSSGRDSLYGDDGDDNVDGGPGLDFGVSCGAGFDTASDSDNNVGSDCEDVLSLE